MGCRVCMNLLKQGKIIGNCYFQSAGYLDETLDLLGRMIGSLILLEKCKKSHLQSDSGLDNAVGIFDFFSDIGGYVVIDKDNENNELYKYLKERRSYRIGDTVDVNERFIISNIVKASVHRGNIGLTPIEKNSNERGATYNIYIHIDKNLIDMSHYFYESSKEEIDEEIKEYEHNTFYNIVKLKQNLLKIKFDKFFSIGKILMEGYCYKNENYKYTSTLFEYKNKFYSCE